MRFAPFIRFIDDVLKASFLDEANSGLKSNEVAEPRHVDPVAIRIANLRSTGGDDDALGTEAVEYAQNGTLECGAPDDAVVNHNEVVLTSLDGAVSDIVDVRNKIIPTCIFRNKRPQFRVFDGNFFNARSLVENSLHFSRIGIRSHANNPSDFGLILIVL